MSDDSERVLVCAPFGRDAQLIQQVLVAGGMTTDTCAGVDNVCEALSSGAGALLISDEALFPSAVRTLCDELSRQPPWSDLAVLVMTTGGSSEAASAHRLRLLEPIQGPVTLLERPLRAVTLTSAVRSALRARRRQYQVRDLLRREAEISASLSAVNQALRQSNEGLAQFAYAASHDLQEPLRAVSLYTQLLKRRYGARLDADANQYMQFAVDGSVRMSHLIANLLEYARATSELSLTPPRTDSGRALTIVQEHLALLLQESGAVIERGPLPEVDIDAAQLGQVLQNLIVNAVKYRHPDRSPVIRISATRVGPDYRFVIADNGVGFLPQHAEQIFGVFKRLHGREIPGTGMGLAICKRIVEHYGGRIWAEAQPDQGATFFFTLPAHEETSAPNGALRHQELG